jgi:hypothetical protein
MAQVKNFTVENPNGFPFPIDMLRYDACYPRTEQDAGLMTETFDIRVSSKERRVKVELTSTNPFSPTEDRWKSFGWIDTV